MATCGGKRNYQFLIYSITHHFPVTVNKLKLPHEMGSRFFSVLRSFSKKKQEGNHSIAFACVTFSDIFSLLYPFFAMPRGGKKAVSGNDDEAGPGGASSFLVPVINASSILSYESSW